jgi:hypothetical protein
MSSEAVTGSDDGSVLRLRSPTDVCEAVPYLVGFEPTESLVVVSLRGPRQRAGLTARIDLLDPGSAPAMASFMVEHLERDRASAAIVVAYSEAVDLADVAVRALLDACDDRGIAIAEALRVTGGRWTSYTCSSACCPPAGTPVRDRLDEPSTCAAVMTLEGRQVLASRSVLEDSIAPVRGLLAAAIWDRLDHELDGFLAAVRSLNSSAYADETVQLARSWVGRVASGEVVTVDAAARMLAGLLDRVVRDRCLGGGMGGLVDEGEPPFPPEALELWRELVRRAVVPGTVAPAATLLAASAYLDHGNGALANVALDRALHDQPTYVMAQYLRTMLDGGIAPSTVRQWLDR